MSPSPDMLRIFSSLGKNLPGRRPVQHGLLKEAVAYFGLETALHHLLDSEFDGKIVEELDPSEFRDLVSRIGSLMQVLADQDGSFH